MDLNYKTAVAACHLDEGRRIVDLLRNATTGRDRYPAIHDVAVLLDAA